MPPENGQEFDCFKNPSFPRGMGLFGHSVKIYINVKMVLGIN